MNPDNYNEDGTIRKGKKKWDGTWQNGTSAFEKRGVEAFVPQRIPEHRKQRVSRTIKDRDKAVFGLKDNKNYLITG